MISLANHKTLNNLVTEIKMTRTTHKGSFLLLEGADDCRFFSARVAQCELVDCGGKPNVLGVLPLLAQNDGILGVVDHDYDWDLSISYPDNVTHTHVHDLECLLLQSHALDHVVAEFADPTRLKSFEARGESVRDALIRRGLLHGQLRWLNARLGWPMDFKLWKVRKFLDKNWDLDRDQVLKAAINQGCPLTQTALEAALAALPAADPWRVCRGHDLVDILCDGLSKLFGQKGFRENQVPQVLRQALDKPSFLATPLANDILAWERTHPPYQVLR